MQKPARSGRSKPDHVVQRERFSMLLGFCAVVITSCKGVCPARSEVMCAVYDCGLDTQRLFPFEYCRRKGTKQIVHAAKARSRDLNLALTNAKSSLWMLQTFEKCFLFAWSRCRLMSTPSCAVDRHNQPAAWSGNDIHDFCRCHL